MNTSKIILLCLMVCALSACDDIRTRLHLMPNQDEQQCLNSQRFNFKDPDVLFVANLGNRGLAAVPGQYWVRYKAKNSYGAYVQGNMLCKKNANTGGWERNEIEEYRLKMKVTIALFLERNERRKKNPSSYVDPYPGLNENARSAATQEEAKEIIFTLPDDLTKYVEKS